MPPLLTSVSSGSRLDAYVGLPEIDCVTEAPSLEVAVRHLLSHRPLTHLEQKIFDPELNSGHFAAYIALSSDAKRFVKVIDLEHLSHSMYLPALEVLHR